ncbi:MAG: hypothetical protein M0042_13505 [Nitrospiraceae bacterium]|nr:hypothetical protein [Nitrospiraceae bacterium]
MMVGTLMNDITKVDTEAVAVGFFEDLRPLKGSAGAIDWLLCGALSRLVIDNRIRGALGEVALVTNYGKIPASKIFLVGLGPSADRSPESLRRAARSTAEQLIRAGVQRAVVDLFPLAAEPDEGALAAARDGLRDGAGNGSLQVAMLARDSRTLAQMNRVMNG